jgi:hypothetical protein
MTIEGRQSVKDNLIIVATSLNILLALGAILGGMNWISEVNRSQEVITRSLNQLEARMDNTERALREVDKRHAIEDAGLSSSLKGLGPH